METKQTPPENQADRSTWDQAVRIMDYICDINEEIKQLEALREKADAAYTRHLDLLLNLGYDITKVKASEMAGMIYKKPPMWLTFEQEFID